MKRSFSKLIILVLGATLVMALGLLLAWTVYARVALAGYKHQLISKGEILDIPSLTPPHVKPEENAGPQLAGLNWRLNSGHPLLADYCMPADRVAPGRLRTLWQQPSPPRTDRRTNDVTWLDLANCYMKLQPVVVEARQVLNRPHLDNNLTYSNLAWSYQPQTMIYRRLGLALEGAVITTLHEKELAEARDNLLALLNLTILMEEEPTFLTQMVGISIGTLSYELTWQGLQVDGWTDSDLALLQQAWQHRQPTAALARAVQMERTIGLHQFERVRHTDDDFILINYFGNVGQMPSRPQTVDTSAWMSWLANVAGTYFQRTVFTLAVQTWRLHFSYGDERLYLQLYEEFLIIIRTPSSESDFCRKISLAEQMTNDLLANGIAYSLRQQFTRIITPNFASILKRLATYECQKEMVITAIALKRYAMRHGLLPERLQALTPEFLPAVPIDPMDSQPLRYQRLTSNGFLLYSVGLDGRDDGGEPAPLKRYQAARPNAGEDLAWPQAATAADLQTASPK